MTVLYCVKIHPLYKWDLPRWFPWENTLPADREIPQWVNLIIWGTWLQNPEITLSSSPGMYIEEGTLHAQQSRKWSLYSMPGLGCLQWARWSNARLEQVGPESLSLKVLRCSADISGGSAGEPWPGESWPRGCTSRRLGSRHNPCQWGWRLEPEPLSEIERSQHGIHA